MPVAVESTCYTEEEDSVHAILDREADSNRLALVQKGYEVAFRNEVMDR